MTSKEVLFIASPVQKKGADRGIDGRLYFHDEPRGGKTKQIIFSVKAGHVQSAYVQKSASSSAWKRRPSQC
jgi:hypothetical protein